MLGRIETPRISNLQYLVSSFCIHKLNGDGVLRLGPCLALNDGMGRKKTKTSDCTEVPMSCTYNYCNISIDAGLNFFSQIDVPAAADLSLGLLKSQTTHLLVNSPNLTPQIICEATAINLHLIIVLQRTIVLIFGTQPLSKHPQPSARKTQIDPGSPCTEFSHLAPS